MSAMHDLTGSLGKKIGPLKVWQYGAIIGGSILLYGVMRKKGVSLGGANAATSADSEANLYDAGQSVSGSGTVSNGAGNGTAPQVITVQLPAAVGADSDSASIADTDKDAQIAAQRKEIQRQRERAEAWKDWGGKWKTQAYLNAGNLTRGTNKKTAKSVTKKKALPSTTKHPINTPVSSVVRSSTNAKRTTVTNRQISPTEAKRRELVANRNSSPKRKSASK